MNKKYVRIGILVILVILTPLFFMAIPAEEPELSYTSNPDLAQPNAPEGWKGTPSLSNGTYQNLYHPFESSLWNVAKWKLGKNPQVEQKEKDYRRLSVTEVEVSANGTDQLIWLGHASYFIRVDGVTLLTDPVWFDNLFLKRQSELPLSLEQIESVDYILISHDHRDHCDENSISKIGAAFPNAKFLVGLSMKDLVGSWLPDHDIQEAGWFQYFSVSDSLEITFVPARHWSRRGLMDQNERLWGGFYIQSKSKSIYFMGDSGYGPHFNLIRESLGSPDYALMGVGAFRPEWFMKPAHISPTDAIKAFNELNASHFIPMHFGTFDLSDEPLLEPLDILQENRDQINGNLIVPVVGKNLFEN